MKMPKMVIVKLTRDLRPTGRAGETRVLPEELARQLLEEGGAVDMQPFPPPDVAPHPGTLHLPVSTPRRTVKGVVARVMPKKG